MEINKAFEILNLSVSASKEDIKSRFKELSKIYHPDKGGNESKMSELNSANDIANEFASNKALISVVQELTRADNKIIIRSQEIEREMTAISNRAIKRVGNKLKSYKDTTLFMGVASGIATLVTTKIIPVLDLANDSILPKVSIIATAIMGLYYIMFNNKVKRLEEKVTEFKESLDEKEFLFDLLTQICVDKKGDKKGDKISKSEFLELLENWKNEDGESKRSREDVDLSPLPWADNYRTPRKISRLIGLKDFSKLLLLKGEQQGFIKKEEEYIKSKFEIKYKVL